MSATPRRRVIQSGLLAACLLLPSCGAPPPPPNPRPEDNPGNDPQRGKTAASQVLALANGMTTFLAVAETGGDSQAQLGVFAGTLFVAPGLAELAAEVLVKSSDPSSGRRSLEQEIAAIGGTVAVRVGLTATWFDLRVPTGKLTNAITALRRALESVTTSRHQIERMRSELVRARSAAIVRDPLASVARVLLLGELGTDAYINALLDLDASQVNVFLSRLYRPERCLLAVSSPSRMAVLVKSVQEPDQDAIAGWQPPVAMPGSSDLLPRQFVSGLYWSEASKSDGKIQAAIVLRLPDATQPGAAELLMMHACLTLDGTGGRLERLQDEAGLGHLRWQARLEQTPDARALVMTTEATSQEAIELWRVLQRARKSLVDVPPSPSELQLAQRRARLSAGLAMLDDSARLRITAGLLTRGLPVDAIERRLDELAAAGSWNVAEAAQSYQALPAWMVVIGGQRPKEQQLAGLRAFDLLPEGFDPQNSGTAALASTASVDPWLARAKAAAGGSRAIANLAGFTATARLAPEQAPEVLEEVTWHHRGSLARRRTVLEQTVETVLEGNRWVETLNEVTQTLTAPEATLLKHEMQRHPLMLLAAHSRGDLKFRAVAQRRVGDRQFMVLEAIDDGFDRLRIHLDTESGLIRVVESWERLADDTIVHVRDSWSDYRGAGSLRTPHLRRTTWNDGQHRSETTYTSWTPTPVGG